MFKQKGIQRYIFTAFALIILISSWEYNLSHAAIAESAIPQESIRLRILANSDGARDQWIKREVRNEVVKHMNEWVQELSNIDDAREVVNERLSSFERLIGELLTSNGFNYTYKVELGVVDFPTKLYGNQVYPAGEYEALRVTLGSGEGQNWWCVLFPPLCFVDLAAGSAVTQKDLNEHEVDDTKAGNTDDVDTEANDTEIRFFMWDMIKQVINMIKGVFSAII